MRAVASWKFATETRGRVDFVGIAQVVRVHYTADELMGSHIGFCKHERHIRLLINTDSMLTGNTATVSHTAPQNLSCQFFSLSFSTLVAFIIEHQGMQIAIACMED